MNDVIKQTMYDVIFARWPESNMIRKNIFKQIENNLFFISPHGR